MKERSNLAMILNFAKSQKYIIVLSSICSILTSLFSIVPYFLIISIIEYIIEPNYNGMPIETLIFLSISAGVLYAIFLLLTLALSHIAAFTILHQIRVNVIDHLGHLPLGFFKKHSSGMIKKSMDEDIEKLELFIAHQIPDFVENLVVPLLIVIYLMFKNWILGLLLFVPVIIFMIIQGIMMSKYGDGMKKYVVKMTQLHSAIVEYIHGMNVFKAFNLSASRFKSYKNTTEDYLNFWCEFTYQAMPYYAISYVIVDSGLLFTLPIGGLLYFNNMISGIDYIAFLFLSSVFLNGLLKLVNMARTLQMVLSGADNIKRIISTDKQTSAGQKLNQAKGDITIKNLSFAYEDDAVLKDINLSLKPGTINALVGKSGSGKTTLGLLLGRFYDTARGMITIDGIDIQDIEFNSLMDHTAFVFQNTFLLTDSVYNNILLGLDRTKEQVVAAAKAANIHNFIESLSDGYNTIIGDGSGIKLSGGEKQRISVARAMLKDAPIVVLDEVTSYSDIENELDIQQAIRQLLKNRTGIIIAHRLYTIKDADQIIVLDEGRIVQKGKHETLINATGPYRDFWQGGVESC